MADFYWIGPAGGNWSTVGNWSSTSGGASNGSIPGSTDNVFFTRAVNTNSVVDIPFTINNLTFATSIAGGLNTMYTGTLSINPVTGYDFPLEILNTIDVGSAPYGVSNQRVFTGAAGWKADKLINSGFRGVVAFAPGVEYMIVSSFINKRGFPASTNYNWVYYSGNGGNAFLTLGKNAVCEVFGTMFNIDASRGRTITNWQPGLVAGSDNSPSCVNVLQYRRGRQISI